MRTMIALALLGLCFAGCASTTIDLKFVSIEPVNVDEGKSRVVDIRIYQLKDAAKWDASTAAAIWDDPKAALGDSLIEVKQGESIFPEKADTAQGKVITLDPLSAECKFIGIVAQFGSEDTVGKPFIVATVDEADDVVFRLTGYHIAKSTK